MDHLFLSDVHLGAFTNEKDKQLENELIKLIDYCDFRNIQMHILGDLFDYWMEFKNFIPELGRSVLNRFQQYNRGEFRSTTFITGNHDYWTLNHFDEQGFRVEHEYVQIQMDHKNIFLCHGDGLTDHRFQLPRPLLHRILRNDMFIKVYKSIFPGNNGLHVMKKFSSATRDEEYVNPARLNEWAKFMLKKFSYDVIITGHDHVPRKETFSNGLYINTGAFHKYKTVAIYKNGAFELVKWDDGKNELEPFAELV